MLIGIKTLRHYAPRAVDGEIGSLHDFYFEDTTWQIRTAVIATGTWLPGRRVLLPVTSFCLPRRETEELPVIMTRDEIRQSPDWDTARPVSRQEKAGEDQATAQPHWPLAIPPDFGQGPVPAAPYEGSEAKPRSYAGQYEDRHLQSVRSLTGYALHAADGNIGHAEDFIVDAENWIIRYMVVDTGTLLSGKSVLIPPQWITSLAHDEHKIHVDLCRESVKNSPAYDPAAPPERKYEQELYDYYARKTYWCEEPRRKTA